MVKWLTAGAVAWWGLAGLHSVTAQGSTVGRQGRGRSLPASDPFCTPASARIVILGTFHFDSPGLDARNVEADVLAPVRKKQVQEIVDRLARYRPTKIMVEAPYHDLETVARYRRYLAGQYQLGRNETEQLGFRLAKQLGLPTIIPIDFPMRMSGLRPDEVDDTWHPRQVSETPAPAPAKPAELTEEQKLLQRSTLREFLLRTNDPERAEAEFSKDYLPLLLPDPDSPALYAKSDYLVNWYKRNFRMFANIARETRFPEDRVLVIVGSGHLKPLRDLARDAEYFCLADAADYLR